MFEYILYDIRFNKEKGYKTISKHYIIMLNPIYIQKYNIYDIFHNDNNNIIIISPMEQSQLVINYKNINFDVNICSHNHTYIYVLQKQIDYINQITLTINSEIIETKVNKYQEFKDKIIFSTIVLNEENFTKTSI